MSAFRFYTPTQVRYGDLDPQWHLNNVRTLGLFEQSRFEYLIRLGLWDGQDFLKLGLIVADVHISYKAPVMYDQHLRIGVRVARIGNKSLTFEYILEDADSGQELATAETVMVAYDYPSHQSIPVPPDWRSKITAFEGL